MFSLRQIKDMSSKSESITVVKEKLIPAGIDEVWKFLTDGPLLTQWFATTDGLKPDGGFVFEFGDGDFFSGRVVEWQKPATLGITWKFLGTGHGSRIDYSLQADGESTFLTLRDNGALTPDEAVGLDEGWDDFLMRLIRRIETGQPTRYRWTETFGGAAFVGHESPIEVDAFDEQWWRTNFPGIHVALDPVQPNESNTKRFIVRDDSWGELTTTATLRVRQLAGSFWATVSHEGWVKFAEAAQLPERRRFARLWERALKRLEENSSQAAAAASLVS